MEENKTKKSLKYSVYDGAAFAIMDGMTANFLTPFAVALKASVSMIAALTYVPQLVGAFIQLFAAKTVEIFSDRRKIIVASSLINAVLWIPLLLIPYLTPNHRYLLIIYVSLQTLVSQLANPVWNSLMGDIVPKYERGNFFGLRNKVVESTSFLAALSAGLILNYFSAINPFFGFTILFSAAFIGRMLSSVFRCMMHSPAPESVPVEKFSVIDFVKKMDNTNYGHFVSYIVLFKLAVSVSSPFFAVYMLRDLKLSYLQYTFVIAAELVGSFSSMGLWGRIIDKRGTKFVLYAAGLLTPIVPFLWLFSKNIYWLILVELFTGFAFAGFNLSTSNFIFDSVQPENRVRCIAYYKFFEGIAAFLGAALGGFLVAYLPAWIFVSSIPIVFIISGIFRIAVSLTQLQKLKEARLIELGLGHSFFKRFLMIRPSEGFVFDVIGKYHKHDEEKRRKVSQPKAEKQKPAPKKEDYNRRLMKFIDKNISPKKERHELTDMHEIEHITEEIEKGKRGK